MAICGLLLSAGVWESMRHHLVVMLREGAGREASPTAAIVDTQSVKTTESGGPRGGYDAAKTVNGRKRHIAVDTQGLLLGVLVHVASIQDADGAGDLLRRVKPLYCWLRTVFRRQRLQPRGGPARLFPARHHAGRRQPHPRHERLCRAATPLGWSNAHSVGLAVGGACPGIASTCPRSPRPWSPWAMMGLTQHRCYQPQSKVGHLRSDTLEQELA